MRTRRLSQLLAALSVVAVGAAVPEAPAAGTTTCRYPDRHVFAVAADGKLHELARCVYAPGQHRPATNRRIIEDLGVVDGGDWRAQRWVTAAVDGAVTTVWTVEADGRLVRRVQSAPGTPLGPPEVVEVGRDWEPVIGLIATPHTLLMEYQAPRAPKPPPGRSTTWPRPGHHRTVRVFTPTGTGLVEGAPLFTRGLGSTLLSVSDGFGEAIHGTVHKRIFRDTGTDPIGDNPALLSGTLPANLHGLAGDEDFLGGLDADGRISVLRQNWRQPGPPYHDPMVCAFNPAPFLPYVMSRSTGWVRLVVPGRADPGSIADRRSLRWDDCPAGDGGAAGKPWEWQ